MRLLYTFIFYCLLPLMLARLLWRSLKTPAYRRRLLERFGFYPYSRETIQQHIWLHAVSVGETLGAAPFIEALLKQYPTHRLLITSTTPTGSAQVQRLFGNRVNHCYAPYDLPDCLNRFLTKAKPSIVIIMETEVWPNMITQCEQQSIPVILANARLSEKSYRGYARFASLFTPVFSKLTLATAQSAADQQHLIDLGAKNTIVTGSIKNDFTVSKTMQTRASALKRQWLDTLNRNVRLIIAASTHKGEDELILKAFAQIQQQIPDILLLIAPRHQERFEAVAQLCTDAGFSLARRQDTDSIAANTQVLLIDTLGELQTLFGTAELAIMGGTFIEHGGHNFLEPAAWGLPILAGKSSYNFAATADALRASGALEQLDTAGELAAAILKLLNSSDLLERRGNAAKQTIESGRGAIDKTLEALAPYIKR